MAERSFSKEVDSLRLGAGAVFEGEGILAVTKALLQSGVAYVGGYQGAPISHLLDVFAEADGLLRELGVRFEANATEAGAAAMLSASINYPLRGAVAWKSVVGTNVASDALSNIASAGVIGGALVIVGEDYGEGSSIVQERTHAFAMKSQMWLLDPRPNLPSIVAAVENGFKLSEATHTPVILQLRIRTCHMTGRFTARDNVRPRMTTVQAAANPRRDTGRIVLPPALFAHEAQKIEERRPAALDFITAAGLNEHFGPDEGTLGIIVQGGLFNGLNRALELEGRSDSHGSSDLPILCLNVTYPLVPDEVIAFCSNKHAVLLIEEGQPEFIEHEINTVLRRSGLATLIRGKGLLPRAGEYTTEVIRSAVSGFLREFAPELAIATHAEMPAPDSTLAATVPARPPGFCTGCPERPVFTAMKLLEREIGPSHVSADIGCHLFSTLGPFNIGATTAGYGLGTASASALSAAVRRPIAVMGDGGFWHNGLTSGIGNAVFNRDETVTVVIDNGYAAATGGQDNLSSKAKLPNRATGQSVERAARAVGVEWAQTIHRTYDVSLVRKTLRNALTSPDKGPKLIVAQSECMLNKQRREKPRLRAAVQAGRRTIHDRFGVDADTCTGDHSCIRISGCPSLTVQPNPDPLREDPVAHVNNDCVGCGLCGEASHAAVLCPSFYRARLITNPNWRDRWLGGFRRALIARIQAWARTRHARRAY
ncbi:MAG: indolepyruvate ferredoxin oxidoreductase subunit alpha [Proteobacteria bacterium]|nr:indolepyruvate ferredoxin oxidoreductase subunit alpha [Pseudomonadota bacterium]